MCLIQSRAHPPIEIQSQQWHASTGQLDEDALSPLGQSFRNIQLVPTRRSSWEVQGHEKDIHLRVLDANSPPSPLQNRGRGVNLPNVLLLDVPMIESDGDSTAAISEARAPWPPVKPVMLISISTVIRRALVAGFELSSLQQDARLLGHERGDILKPSGLDQALDIVRAN